MELYIFFSTIMIYFHSFRREQVTYNKGEVILEPNDPPSTESDPMLGQQSEM